MDDDEPAAIHGHVHPGAERDSKTNIQTRGRMSNRMSLEDFDDACEMVDPWQPCADPPGSDEKMAVISSRLFNGVPLWNPRDATLADTSRTMEGFVCDTDEDEESDEW